MNLVNIQSTGVTPILAIPFVETDTDEKPRRLTEGETITVPASTRRLNIYPFVLSYGLDDPRVSYYLEGFDREPIISSREDLSQVSYTNLKGGTYTFHLDLADESGEARRASVTIVKMKAFYEQPVFWIAVVSAILIAWIVRQMLRQQARTLEHKAREEERRKEEERISRELNMAASIQAGALPSIFPAFPDRKEFDIYASMTPAKEVGGDFYDFFMIDSDHLGLVMADVSGKGIPAALFMMISKILIKTRAQSGLSPAQVLKAVNEQICNNNREDMFVTVWLGVLELSTGRLTASNAGHEYPIISSADGSFELFHDRHGFVIGGMSSSKYTDYTIDLAPGSCIFLYTDGVMEAANREGERFGSDRLIKVLNSNSEKTPKEIIEAVSIAADNFSMDTDQFDDITMLCLRYNGESGIRFDSSLNIEAETDFQPRVMDFIDEKLESYGVGMKDASRIKIASDELFSNVSKFAYRGMEKGDIKVEIGRSDDHRSVFLRFSDSGAPFDPLKGKTPDTTLSADDREIGGLGIFLTRKLMDDVKYEYRNGMNTVTIRKDIDI